jgi:hypothetical protein
LHDNGKNNYTKISIAVTLGIVFVSVIVIVIIGNTTFDDYVTERDQRNLQFALNNCKAMFNQGFEQDDCIEKSIRMMGTDEQKKERVSFNYNQ